MLVLVTPIVPDQAVGARLPSTYSADALRREMDIALEATGLFSSVERSRSAVQGVIDERRAAGRGSTRFHDAQLVLNPTLEGFSLAERRRHAPRMRDKDSVSVRGTLSLTVEVIDERSGGAQTRMPIDITYTSPEHLEDPRADDRLPNDADGAVNLPPSPEELRVAYQEMARAFANRVLEQVSPTEVAAIDGDQLYLTRGEDSGYHVGDRLEVRRVGKPVINPVTHEVLGTTDDTIAQATVTEIRPKLTVAHVTGATRAIAVGDIVRTAAAMAADD
ncbi:MAG TPA: hypothetical protein VGG29_20340 [Caulobacteraceae bacterium]